MTKRSVRALAVAGAVFAALSPLQVDAARPPTPGDASTSLFKPALLPHALSKAQVTVVVQLAGDPVALHQEAAGRKLVRAEKDQIKAQLRASQEGLRSNIQGAGGTVLANYQAAYNGIKVRIRADQVAQLAALPGVVAVRPVSLVRPTNTVGVPLVGGPAVWQSLGLHGEHVKVGIIDTGIDYTHANFGGPGTVAAYQAALAADTQAPDPRYFGPNAPRVKGGIDLVGDDYNADPTDPKKYQPIPHPDANPLDCEGHGSHVAGTAAGSGVTADGKTYTGRYNANTVSGNQWIIGPGVAPKADLYAIRVFGCAGSTDVITDAIEWAVDNDMDVINMSLGSDYGTKDSPDAEAASNAARAGVVVVVSAGNAGPNPYMVGSPATANGAIAVAALDPAKTLPGVTMTLPGGATIPVQRSNDVTAPAGTTYQVAVLRTSYPSGPVALGCAQTDYDNYPGGKAALAGKLVVSVRGTCARVAKAIIAQTNGAAASAMIDTSTGYPPVEGAITTNPDTGAPFVVTIPFFGVRGLAADSTSDGGKLRLADGGSASITNSGTIPNPNALSYASFSSGGARSGDSHLKPDVTAPGVATVSTGMGTGNLSATESGTSMAAPHVTGVAALTVQAHPDWSVAAVMASIVNTGDPTQNSGFDPRIGGTGLVQANRSTVTQVTARSDERRFPVALNFGYQELSRNYSERKTIVLENKGSTAANFYVSDAYPAGLPHTVSIDRSVVRVPARGSAQVGVTLSVPVTADDASNQGGFSFHDASGLIQFVPVTGNDNLGTTLRVPYYVVPRALADISTKLGKLNAKNPSAIATVTNRQGAIPGDADFYAWGLSDSRNPKLSIDVRAVGVQSFPFDAKNQLGVFAINTFDRMSNPASKEFDVYVDVDGDGVDDYVIVCADAGAITTGSNSGQAGVFVFSLLSGAGSASKFAPAAATDTAIVELPFLSSQLCLAGEPCLSATNPRMTYHVEAFDPVTGDSDPVKGAAKVNLWSPSISTGGFVGGLPPKATDSSVQIDVDRTEWTKTPAKGVMVITLDNQSGGGQAQLIDVDPN